jgi:hypothetical protein
MHRVASGVSFGLQRLRGRRGDVHRHRHLQLREQGQEHRDRFVRGIERLVPRARSSRAPTR